MPCAQGVLEMNYGPSTCFKIELKGVTPREFETCLNVFLRSFRISAIAIRRSGESPKNIPGAGL